MWFQKNPHVVHGTWAVVNKFGKPRACYHYFNSTDYVTHEYEPTECIEPAQDIAAMGVLAVRTGDIFNLRSGKIPYLKGAMDIPALPDPPIAPAR